MQRILGLQSRFSGIICNKTATCRHKGFKKRKKEKENSVNEGQDDSTDWHSHDRTEIGEMLDNNLRKGTEGEVVIISLCLLRTLQKWLHSLCSSVAMKL